MYKSLSNAVQLNGFFGKTFYHLQLVFLKYNFTCVFICFFIFQSTFFILLFFSTENFSRFTLDFVRTLGSAVDKLFNDSS